VQIDKSGKIKEYLGWLEKLPEKKVIDKFSASFIPKVRGYQFYKIKSYHCKTRRVSFDPIQNIQAKMMTKVTLLLVVESESKKLGIWHEIQSRWTENTHKKPKDMSRSLR